VVPEIPEINTNVGKKRGSHHGCRTHETGGRRKEGSQIYLHLKRGRRIFRRKISKKGRRL